MKASLNTHRGRVRALALTVLAALALGTAAACTSGTSSSVAAGNAISNATYAEFSNAVPYPFANQAPSDPLERKNLAARLTQYNAKGDTNYVYILAAQTGTPIGYYVIEGKVSSTGSEMTATQLTTNCSGGNNPSGCAVLDAVGDDGSYGPEEGGGAGVFFFTATGVLVETDMPFLVSSAPIKLYASVPQLDAPAN